MHCLSFLKLALDDGLVHATSGLALSKLALAWSVSALSHVLQKGSIRSCTKLAQNTTSLHCAVPKCSMTCETSGCNQDMFTRASLAPTCHVHRLLGTTLLHL